MITVWGSEQAPTDERNAIYRLKIIEDRFRQSGTGGALSLKKARQIIDANQIADIPEIPQKTYTGIRSKNVFIT